MKGGVGLGRWVLFWAIALGGAAFDLATKSIIFERVGAPLPRRLRSSLTFLNCTRARTLALSGALARDYRKAARSSPRCR